MSLDREKLLGVAHAERQRLGRMIQFAEPDTWEQPSAAEGWWNRDVMAHLGAGDTVAAQLMAGEAPTELDEYHAALGEDPFTVDGFNAWTVNRRSEIPTRDLLTVWGTAAASLIEHAALLSPQDWEERRFEYVAGPIAARYLIQTRIVEWWLHGEDVRATNGLGPAYQHWPIHLTIDMAVRMLPYALNRAGLDLSGRTVKVVAEGAGEGTWHWGLGAGEVPAAKTKPDAIISGRASQLGLVAGRRLKADDVYASGNVVVGGDQALALTVLQNLRAYP